VQTKGISDTENETASNKVLQKGNNSGHASTRAKSQPFATNCCIGYLSMAAVSKHSYHVPETMMMMTLRMRTPPSIIVCILRVSESDWLYLISMKPVWNLSSIYPRLPLSFSMLPYLLSLPTLWSPCLLLLTYLECTDSPRLQFMMSQSLWYSHAACMKHYKLDCSNRKMYTSHVHAHIQFHRTF
jgi:hypothetical protein